MCQGSRSLGVCARAPAGGCAGAATEPELCTQCVRKRQILWRASQLARRRTLPLLSHEGRALSGELRTRLACAIAWNAVPTG